MNYRDHLIEDEIEVLQQLGFMGRGGMEADEDLFREQCRLQLEVTDQAS